MGYYPDIDTACACGYVFVFGCACLRVFVCGGLTGYSDIIFPNIGRRAEGTARRHWNARAENGGGGREN